MSGVAVTGYGAITPLGAGANTTYERWCAGASGLEDGVGRCRGFHATDYLSIKEMRRTDRFAQLAIGAGDEALSSAGWQIGDFPYAPERIGCVIGTGVGGLNTLEAQHDIVRDRGPDWVSPLAVPLLMANAAAATLAIRYGAKGENYGVVSACAAGAQAIGAAYRLLQLGDLDAVIAGGAESALTPLTAAAFARMGATSMCGISRPFDARRDGFVAAEGAGVLVLERGDLAVSREAEIRGRLLGYGSSSDAFHLTAPDERGEGAARAIELALRDAGVDLEEVDFVNLHGTSTPLNDRSETFALKHVFGERVHRIPMSAPKSAIGHMLGAAGAVEAILTLCSLQAATVPPTLNYEVPELGLDLDYVADGPRLLADGEEGLVGISNAFGFGGHNAVLVFGGVGRA